MPGGERCLRPCRLAFLRRRARHAGAPGGSGGAVAIIPALRAALNLNVDIHVPVLDDVYVEGDGGRIRRPSFPLADYELAISLAACHKSAAWRSNEGSAARTKIALAPNAARGWQSHSGLSPIIQIGAPGIAQRSAASNIWACGFS